MHLTIAYIDPRLAYYPTFGGEKPLRRSGGDLQPTRKWDSENAAARLRLSEVPITVSIVEDDRRVRESLALLINGTSNLRCVSAHRSTEEALQVLPTTRPDVVLMDLNLPKMSGAEGVRRLKTAMPGLQILMLALYEDEEQVFLSLAAGANGYLVKRSRPAELLRAIEDIHMGAFPMSGKIARSVLEHFRHLQQAGSGQDWLTTREKEILELFARGYRGKEIAGTLGLGSEAIRAHLKSIYEKLQVHSQLGASAGLEVRGAPALPQTGDKITEREGLAPKIPLKGE